MNKNLSKTLKDFMQQEFDKLSIGPAPLEIMKVTDINKENYTINVRDLNWRTIEYTDVPIIGYGLGNLKGIMKLPNVDDLVVIGWIGKGKTTPVVLGTVFDIFTQTKDSIPQINANEFFLTNKEQGSILYIKQDNSVIIKVADENGVFNGPKLRLNNDGSFKLFNKDNYGIECDASGNITIRGSTVNFSQTQGAWP